MHDLFFPRREWQGFLSTKLHPSEDGSLARQSLTYSRTFGRPLAALANVRGAVTAFASRAAAKLRVQGEQARADGVRAKKRFDPRVPPPYLRSATLTLPGRARPAQYPQRAGHGAVRGGRAGGVGRHAPALAGAGVVAEWAFTTRLADLLTVQ